MKNERIISIESKSKIYHRPECQHVKRMKYKNRLSISKGESRNQGYRPCRCCNGMSYLYKQSQGELGFYRSQRNMQFKYLNGILYVKTAVSCWKLVYCRQNEQLALYHRNYSDAPINMKMIQNEAYHRQGDVPYQKTIEKYLSYIYKHDKFRESEMRGDKKIHYSSKKYERNAERAKWKRSVNRVDYLFQMLESQNSGYRELSFC